MARKLRILCVDKDEDALHIASLSLGLDADISIVTARNACDALAVLGMPGMAVSCVLVDPRMAEGSSSALLATIRTCPEHAELPVIFLSACATQKDITQHLAVGAAGTITKPYDPTTLAAQVRGFLDAGCSAECDASHAHVPHTSGAGCNTYSD